MFQQKLPKYMTQEEMQTFFSKIKSKRDLALFGLVYKYGLRVTETSQLNLKDLDLKRNKIVIRRIKGGVSGEKPLLRDVKRRIEAYLRERKNNTIGLFSGKQGRLKKRRIQQLFTHYLKKAKLLGRGYTVHSLRHSIGTHLLDAGYPLEYVQDHLGHKNIQNTQIYSKISDLRRKKIFEELEDSRDVVRI